MNLYRVKYAKHRGSTSWGDWKYYENEESMLIDLLEASLDIEASGRDSFRSRLAAAFRRQGNDESEYKNIYAVEQVVNDEWVEKKFHYRAPEVWLDD